MIDSRNRPSDCLPDSTSHRGQGVNPAAAAPGLDAVGSRLNDGEYETGRLVAPESRASRRGAAVTGEAQPACAHVLKSSKQFL